MVILYSVDWNLTWATVGSIATVLAVISSFVVLFLQRRFDNKRILAENEPRVALGSFHPEFLTDEIGDYFGTDVSFAENPFQKSKVEIPIVNVGKTPISNIQVKISSPTLKKIIDEWEKVGINSKLNISFFTQLYAIYGDNFDIKYEIIDTNSKRKNIASKTVQTYRIGPIISGEKYLLKLTSREELYIQYILFMLNDRQFKINTSSEEGTGINLVEPQSNHSYFYGFRFDLKYTDYLGKQHNEEYYLGLFSAGFKTSIIRRFSEEGNEIKKLYNWYLAPVDKEQIKTHL